VIPLFHDQIRSGGPVTITTPEMTRFLITLERAVDTVFAALQHGEPGEIYVPQVPSARVIDIADVLIGDRPIKTIITGIRPGEKVHEILVSEEEAHRTRQRGAYYVIVPMLPELRLSAEIENPLAEEFSSADNVMTQAELDESLRRHRLMVEDSAIFEEDLLA
jgi:UDP-glucose 4-epimerase